jgi:hypothetical protein
MSDDSLAYPSSGSNNDIVKEEEMMIVAMENPLRELMTMARRSKGIIALRSRLVRLLQALIELIKNDGWNAPAIRFALVGMRDDIHGTAPVFDGNWFSGFVRADWRDNTVTMVTTAAVCQVSLVWRKTEVISLLLACYS